MSVDKIKLENESNPDTQLGTDGYIQIKEEIIDTPTNEDNTTTQTTTQKNAPEDTQIKIRPQRKKARRPVLSDTIPAIPVASFRRMAKTMADEYKTDLRWEADALEALQVATEAFIVEKFQKAGDTSRLFSRKTVGAELIRA